MPPRQVALFASRGLEWATGEPISASPDAAATTPLSTSSSPDSSSLDLSSSHDSYHHSATMQAEEGNVNFGPQSVRLSVSSSVPGTLRVFIPASHSHEPLRVRLQLRPEELNDGGGRDWVAAATATFAHDPTSPGSPPAEPGSAERPSSANGDREESYLSSSMHDEEQSADVDTLAASSPSPRPLPAPLGVVHWSSQDDQLLREAVAVNRGRRFC